MFLCLKLSCSTVLDPELSAGAKINFFTVFAGTSLRSGVARVIFLVDLFPWLTVAIPGVYMVFPLYIHVSTNSSVS